MEKDLAESGNNADMAKNDVRDAAMGKGDEELYEKNLTKEEKKAAAKAKREAKKLVRECTVQLVTSCSSVCIFMTLFCNLRDHVLLVCYIYILICLNHIF